MAQFKVGDVVRLKSGGVKMTVYGFTTGQAEAKCVWMTDAGEVRQHDFPVGALEGVSTAGPAPTP